MKNQKSISLLEIAGEHGGVIKDMLEYQLLKINYMMEYAEFFNITMLASLNQKKLPKN